MSVASGRGEAGVHRAAQRRVLPQGAAPNRGPLVTLSTLSTLIYLRNYVCVQVPGAARAAGLRHQGGQHAAGAGDGAAPAPEPVRVLYGQ